jgi:hypothetical protein
MGHTEVSTFLEALQHENEGKGKQKAKSKIDIGNSVTAYFPNTTRAFT